MRETLPAYIMQEDAQSAALKRLADIAEAHADGRLSTERARHELQTLIAPVRRRARRTARLLAGSATGQ